MMLILGGTGILGGQLLKRLREERHEIKLLTRGSRDWRDSSVQDIRQKGAEMIIADACDKEKLFQAAEGCDVILNLVGNMPPKVGVDPYALHVTVARNVLEVAKERKIQRIIQMSCLGADANAPGSYLRTKFEADELVQQSDLYWTIFKPSYIFGDKFPYLEALMPFIRFKLFMPIVGSGQHEIQPIHVDDVVSCIVASIYDKDTVHETFELGGSETMTLQELMEMARKSLRLGGVSMNIPSDKISKTTDALKKLLPKVAINVELLQLMLSNSVCENNAVETYFKREPIALEDCFAKIMGSTSDASR